MKTKIILLLMILSAVSLSAIDVKFDKDTYTENSVELNDYVFFGDELIFNGKADNVYFAGRSLTFQGDSESGLTAVACENITVNGTIKNDTHLGAKTIDILSDIEGSVFVGGTDIVIDSTINGDLLAAGMKLTINGVVNGDVYAGEGKIIVEGTINGNLYAKTGKIVFGNDGSIQGNVEYSSDWILSDTEKAKIKGTVLFKEWDKNEFFNEDEFEKNIKWIWPVIRIIFILSFIAAGVLLLVFPVSKNLEKECSKRQFLYTFLWGLIPFFVYPVTVLLAFLLGIVFGITVPIAVVLLLAGLPLVAVTQVIGITLFGQFMFNVFKWKKSQRHLFFLFGMAFAVAVSFIPVLSIIGFIFFSAAGWGRLLESIFNTEFGILKESAA